MPHTLRAVSTSDEDAAALSMLTGFDLDPARQANQTEGRIRGQSFTQTPPSPRDRGGALAGRTTPSRRPVAARHRPSRPETSGQDKDRRQAQEARGSAAHHPGRPGPSHQKIGILHQGRVRLPRRQQETQASHIRLRLRPPRAPTPPPRPTTSANATTANALGQAVLALAHRRIPTLHTTIRNGTLYTPQPTTKLPTAA